MLSTIRMIASSRLISFSSHRIDRSPSRSQARLRRCPEIISYRPSSFFLTSAVGLLLNELLMFLFRVAWGEETVLFTVFSFAVSLYVLNKVLATCIVMVWNYFTKRYILTKK